jgi:hypothetical protein
VNSAGQFLRASAQQRRAACLDAAEHAVAVELDMVDSPVAVRDGRDQGAELRLDPAGQAYSGGRHRTTGQGSLVTPTGVR